MVLFALFAEIDAASQGFGAASDDVTDRTFMAGQHVLAMLFKILRRADTENVRECGHVLQRIHPAVDDFGGLCLRHFRQMRVDRGGAR